MNDCATSSCFSSQELTAEADWKRHGLYIGPAVLISLLFTSAFAKDETFSVRDPSLMLESWMNLIASYRSVASIKTSRPSFPTIMHKETGSCNMFYHVSRRAHSFTLGICQMA